MNYELNNKQEELEAIIKNNIDLLSEFDSSYFNKEIIDIIAGTNYIPDERLISRVPSLLENTIIRRRVIEKYPHLIGMISNIDEDMIAIALSRGYIPTKKDLALYPNLRITRLWNKAFEQDPSTIIYYTGTYLREYVKTALKRGYIATIEDLKINPELCKLPEIMEPLIDKDPQLIKYFIYDGYSLGYGCIANALFKYKLTEEDVENNPSLCKDFYIMEFSKHLEKYSSFIFKGTKKKYIKEVLESHDFNKLKELPFFKKKFGAQINVDDIVELINIIYIDINEENLDEQENYFKILNKVIDGIVNIYYNENKTNFLYRDIVAINDELLSVFSKLTSPDQITKLVKKISRFVGDTLDSEYLTSNLTNLYYKYKESGYISLNDTNKLCNEILNYHRNNYFKITKINIKLDIIERLELTKKKISNMRKNRALMEISRLISLQYFDMLDISKVDFVNKIKSISLKLDTYKEIKKLGLTENDYEELENRFLETGYLTFDDVKNIIYINDKEILRFISQKYERLKLSFLDTILSNDDEFSDNDKWHFALNHNNFIIASNKNYINNLANLIVNLNQDILDKILANKEYLIELIHLIPLVNLISKLDDTALLNILVNYKRVRSKIISTSKYYDTYDTESLILSNIDGLITLSNGYSSIDDTILAILGNEVISHIGVQYGKKYLEIYLKMLQRNECIIPPIRLNYDERIFESGVNYDLDRLLIGAKFKNSCIDLRNPSGEQTFIECLTKETADVIMEKNEHNEFVSRILIFRRGNVVQLVLKREFKCSKELFDLIAQQILNQAILNNDNIDYVFVNECHTYDIEYNLIKDERFVTMFPHSDCVNSAWLINTKNNILGKKEEEVLLDFDVLPKVKYKMPRKKISYNPSEAEITKLRSLNIYFETEEQNREQLARNFEPFYKREYLSVISGEDWYIAIKRDGTYEELVLPSAIPETLIEFKEAQNLLLSKKQIKHI